MIHIMTHLGLCNNKSHSYTKASLNDNTVPIFFCCCLQEKQLLSDISAKAANPFNQGS